MKIKIIFFILLLSTVLSSCSQKAGKTDARIKLNIGKMFDLSAVSAGGAMLWGRSDRGEMFGEVITGAPNLQLELGNGNWMFWAVAWDGAATFAGVQRCAKGGANLNGPDVQVALTLSNEGCTDGDFSPAIIDNAGYSFPSIKHYECDKLSDHLGYGCGSGTLKTKTISKRLIMQGFRKNPGGPFELRGGLVSSCINSNQTFTSEHVPVGVGRIPLHTTIQSFFSNDACDETDPKGFIKSHFEFGLNSPNAGKISYVTTGFCNASNFPQTSCELFGGTRSGSCTGIPTPALTEIPESVCLAHGGSYTDNPAAKNAVIITTVPDAVLCSGKRIDPTNTIPTIFSSGNGSSSSPYSVCTETQMNSIASNYSSSDFSLRSNLDMNNTSIFGDRTTLPCIEKNLGMNFIPIGGLYDGACNLVSSTAFTGSFDGNGYAISNIRLSADVNNIGFIRDGGSIKNLTLKNVEIEGKDNVGAFSGHGAYELTNLKVVEGDIRGDMNVGGVAGEYSSPTTVSNIHVKKLFIRGESANSSVGGLIGSTASLSSLDLKKSSFDGLINLDRSGMKGGGLVGYSLNPYIRKSFSTGVILTEGDSWVGGLTGHTPSGVTIENSYSKISIGPAMHVGGNSGNLGGIIGVYGGTSTVSNTFYYGSILHPCRIDSNNNCGVGTLSGGAAVSNPTNTSGTLTYSGSNWYNTYPASDVGLILPFDNGTLRDNFVALGTGFVSVASGALPFLDWQDGMCTKSANQSSISLQYSLGRGSESNPIILCSRDQFNQIQNHPGLHYRMEDNIAVGSIATSRISDFSGVFDGNGFIVSGIFDYLSSGDGGLIQTNNGVIKNTLFVASFIKTTGAPSTSGLVGINNGVIERNQFISFNTLNGVTDNQGVVAGINNGSILFNKIASSMKAQKNSGLIAGKNSTSGIITGNRVDGALVIDDSANPYYFGGAVGLNEGKISEVEVNATVHNPTTGADEGGSQIGMLVGKNYAGIVEDILISPRAHLKIEKIGPYFGQVFGKIYPSSTIKRVIALNEVAVPDTLSTGNVFSFGAYGTGSSYSKSFFMNGSTFNYHTSYLTIVSCTHPTTRTGSYTFGATITPPGSYADGFYFADLYSRDYLTKRITGTSTVAIMNVDFDSDEFMIPCETGGVTGGVKGYYVENRAPFNVDARVTGISPLQVSTFGTYCSSSNGLSAALKPAYKCDLDGGEEFDMAEGELDGVGFLRLKNAYKELEVNKIIPAGRPIWTLDQGDADDDNYPRLFITD